MGKICQWASGTGGGSACRRYPGRIRRRMRERLFLRERGAASFAKMYSRAAARPMMLAIRARTFLLVTAIFGFESCDDLILS